MPWRHYLISNLTQIQETNCIKIISLHLQLQHLPSQECLPEAADPAPQSSSSPRLSVSEMQPCLLVQEAVTLKSVSQREVPNNNIRAALKVGRISTA